jgi:DNA sulfur modification protein DndD
MYIESIQLRDWKGYVNESYQFPKPMRNKNVVLIGAENGYGKTSLLEALMLCLYGRDGLAYIPRATVMDGDEYKLDLSYDEFIKRAFHGCALESGRNSASVTVTLNEDGQKTRIIRQWYFHGNGKHRASEEEVRIYQGDEPFRVGRLEDQQDGIRNFIAKAFVPVYLAPFFLFDGEQVQRLANKEMASQVRVGIEGLLGVSTLRELQSDLRFYSANRRSGMTRSGDDTAETLQNEIQQLNSEVKQAQRELQKLEPTLPTIKRNREAKVRLLQSVAGGNAASVHELYESKSHAESRKLQLHDRLLEFLHGDLALTISGHALRAKTTAQLRAEEKRESWETGKQQGQPKLQELESAIAASPSADPPLTEAQLQWLTERVESAWDSLWYPPPADCAEHYIHSYFSGRERQTVLVRLDHVGSIALGDLQQITEDLADAEREVAQAEGRIRDLSGVEEETKRLTEEINQLSQQESETSTQVQDLKRRIDGLRAQCNSKSADLERLREQLGRSQPMLQKADLAERIANMIDTLATDMYPLKVDEVASAMTRIYKKLAHKTLLDRVHITENCEVEMLDRNGRDLRRFDASAGENQIFAVALISAIAQVSGAEVPLVVDTPLARLDERHRMNVLQHLASQSGQVILLSATDEVSGPYLRAIEDRVCSEYHLEFEELESGVGITRVHKGYWGAKNERRAFSGSLQ